MSREDKALHTGRVGFGAMVNSSYNGYRYEDVWMDK